jgi:putative CocE/NonD family hydrolase
MQETVHTRIDYDLPVAAADGTTLATDVYRPGGDGAHPVVLVRTPYGKHGAAVTLAIAGIDPLALVRAGYAVVVQDVRGTGNSAGRFRPLRDEASDGAAAIAWAAAQPWSNGAVGMAGPSYLGAVQLAAARERPPALRAIAPTVAFMPGVLHQGGAFRLGNNLPWCLTMALGQTEDAAELQRLRPLVGDVAAAYRRLPRSALTGLTRWFGEAYDDWLSPPERGGFWRDIELPELPALHVTGWYDDFLGSTLATFRALRAAGRTGQRLIVTPWRHGFGGDTVGELWLGPDAHIDLLAAHVAWFDHWLKGEPLVERAPVRIFVQGANRWRDEDDWPLARARPERWYLQADGRLGREPGADEADVFRYDPHEPVPTVSGNGSLLGVDGAFAGGPRDRRRLHARPDVLVYLGDPLESDLEVTGHVTATLHVSTSARDTDFTAALLDVQPDGRAIGIADGILRLRYRDGLDFPALAEPGRVYTIEIDLIATSNVFRAGHRIGVELSSSSFPRFDRNPNHGGVVADATERDFVAAEQRVFHDADRPSFVTLPIVR